MVKRRVNTDNQEEIVKTGGERWKTENKAFNDNKIKFDDPFVEIKEEDKEENTNTVA